MSTQLPTDPSHQLTDARRVAAPAVPRGIEIGLRPDSTLLDPWWVLRQTQHVPLPVNEVFQFFSSAENLERLTPELLGFQILTPGPIQMAVGTRIAYRLRVWGIPIRWLTGIEAWDPPHQFVDVQLRGPYQHWRHLHRFEPAADGGTLMTDEVELQLPGGPLGAIAYALVVRRTLLEIFQFRAAALDRIVRSTSFAAGA